MSPISIHLMLLFISTMLADRIKGGTHFNTSHVTVYLVRMWFWKWHIHFNTSHVTVYRKTWREAVSCYIRISIHLMLLFILMLMQMKTIKIHFNTSHVTVYRRWAGEHRDYISFQYISCYCLSEDSRSKPLIIWNFNTSHVTVYRCKEGRKRES